MTAITDIAAVGTWVRDARAIAVLSGAGMSAESGVPTFRDAQTGLWAKFRPEELATEAAFRADPRRVWDWYASRRVGKGLVVRRVRELGQVFQGGVLVSGIGGNGPTLIILSEQVLIIVGVIAARERDIAPLEGRLRRVNGRGSRLVYPLLLRVSPR